MILISVIIPVYNVAQYLSRCIDSLLVQTFHDFELILVDDGSSDESGIICDKYARRDARVRVIHKENGGASSARNAGLECAEGKWVCFVDSDDYVKSDYLRLLYERTSTWREQNVYLVLTGMQAANWHTTLPDSIIPLPAVPRFIADNHLSLGPCCKLYNTELLRKHGIRFQEGITNGEDFVFVCNYLCCTDGIDSFESKEYVYEIQPGSASCRFMPFDENLQNYRAMRAAWEALIEKVGMQRDGKKTLWSSGVQTRFSSLIIGLFHRPMPSISQQLSRLNSLDVDISDYSTHAVLEGVRSRFAQCLLQRKWYLAYIVYNRLLVAMGKQPAT